MTDTYLESQLDKTGAGVHDGSGGYRFDKRVQKAFDIQAAIIYVGVSPLATSLAGTGWTIQKITLVAGNPTASNWTAVGTAIWNNRAAETYT
jgi:hypothetical protein